MPALLPPLCKPFPSARADSQARPRPRRAPPRNARAGKVKFLDPLLQIPIYIKNAKDQGVGAIILLTHIGAKLDQFMAGDPRFRDADLILGGHSHSLFYDGEPPPLLTAADGTAIANETSPVWGTYPEYEDNAGKRVYYAQASWASRRAAGIRGARRGLGAARGGRQRAFLLKFTHACADPHASRTHINARTHTHMHTSIHTRTHARAHTHAHTRTRACAHVPFVQVRRLL